MDALPLVCMQVTRVLTKARMGSDLGVKKITGPFLPHPCPECGVVSGVNPYTGVWSRHRECTFPTTAEILHEEHAH